MGTTSSISILNKNGTVDSVICQFDGYLSSNGIDLYLYYQNLTKIKKLISLGHLVSLGKEVDIPPGVRHDYWEKHPGITVSVHRDQRVTTIDSEGVRVRDKVKLNHYTSLKEFLKDEQNLFDYNYLFVETKNTWFTIDYLSRKLEKLIIQLKTSDSCMKEEDFKRVLTAEQEVKKLNKAVPLSNNSSSTSASSKASKI